MSRILSVAAAALASAALCTACSADSRSDDSKPNQQATIVDKAPYWCDIVPKNGLQATTGRPASGLTELSPPAPDATPTVPIRCSVERSLLLFERASGSTAARYLKEKPPIGSEPHTRRISKRLGTGAAAGSGQLWHVYAYFHCGTTAALFTLSISDVAKDRDTDADLIRLMEIAQHRYADAAGCTVEPSGQSAASASTAA
jgi:hypothetical protein